jgi:molybdopterin synthase catalytic subunit
MLGVTAPTLRKYFALEISTAAAEATAAVVLALFRAATDATRPNVRAARAWFDIAGRHPAVAAAVTRAPAEGKKAAAMRVAATLTRDGKFKPGAPPRLAAVDGELVADDTPLLEGREVALLPPVSGGSGAARIQDGPLSLEALLEETAGVDAGALVVFAGTVRAEDAGEDIAALEYDVHREMAEGAIREIENDIRSQPGVLACRIAHRVGLVSSGEPSVYVVVRGRHRPETFEAAKLGIDRVKAEAPIWKAEVEGGESRWVEGTPPA